MIVKRLKLSNFRNYKNLDINFFDKINVLYGNNAEGKTNILEAIYFSCKTYSQRKSNEKDLINNNSDECHISIDFFKHNNKITVDYNIFKNAKSVIGINKIKTNSKRELFNLTNIICFSPDDLEIIKGSPEERRRLIDMEISSINKEYLNVLGEYKSVLKEKNSLLKEKKIIKNIDVLLDIYDDRISKLGNYLIEKRKKYIEEISKKLEFIHKELTGNLEKLEIIYNPNVKGNLEENLLKSREKDKLLKTSQIGPHRDEFHILINGVLAKKYGSQGQIRTSILSIRLMEIDLIREKKLDEPVLLLDDVFSELDKKRQEYIINKVKNMQVFITCTGIEDIIVKNSDNYKLFYVENGSVKKIN